MGREVKPVAGRDGLARHNRKPAQIIENNHPQPKSIASFLSCFLPLQTQMRPLPQSAASPHKLDGRYAAKIARPRQPEPIATLDKVR
jgi:hypothetical protein